MKNKKIIRLSLFISIISIWLLVSSFVFAWDWSVVDKTYQDIHTVLVMLVKTMSWIWILIANMAGKLMSNAFVSGGILWLDKYLFQARNIVRVVSNILLVVILFKIWYDVLKDWSAKWLSTKIIKVIVAGVLINLSWFLLWLIVDLSTVMTVSVSGIWNNIINTSPWLKWAIESQYICIPKKYTVNYKENNSSVESIPACLTANGDVANWAQDYYNIYKWDEIIEKISPSQDDMSGPLFYFGMSIFRFFDYTDVNSTDPNSFQDITIWFLIKFFLMLMFITPLIALMVVNFKRMIMIWIRFALSPFIVIKNVIWKDSWFNFIDKIWESVWGISDNKSNFFNIWSIIWAIFTPVTVVVSLYISIFIISAFAWQLMSSQTNRTTLNTELDSKISVDGNTITLWDGWSFSLDADFTSTKDFAWWAIGYILMTLFVTMLLWAVLKVWLSTSDLVSSTWENIMKKGKDTFTQNVTLPTSQWPVSLDQLDKNILTTDNISKNIENLTGISANKKKYKEKFNDWYKNSVFWEYTWIKWKIDPEVKFNPDGNTFHSEEFNMKNMNRNDKKDLFAKKSYNYFKWLYKAIYDPAKWWIVDPSQSRTFVRNMEWWLEKWWYEYLVDKNIIDKNSKYIIEEKDGDKVIWKRIDFDALEKDRNKFGLLIKRLLEKSNSYTVNDDATWFNSIIEEVKKAPAKDNVRFRDTTYWDKK